MSLRKYLRKEYACMKDDKGVTLDFIKLNRKEEIFTTGQGEDKRTYNIKRDEMYDIRFTGLIFTKVIYFYNINNPMPLNFNKTSNAFEPIISPKLYNRMIENEILIKLNTLSSNINYRMILIIAGLLLLCYLAYSLGWFGNDTLTNVTNATNVTNVTGNFTKITQPYIRTVISNTSNITGAVV